MDAKRVLPTAARTKSRGPAPSGAGTGRGMTRREIIQRLLRGAGAGLAFPAIAASHPIHKHLADTGMLAEAEAQAKASDWTPSLFDAHQNETLIALGERIVPGSTRAQTNRFIDLALSAETGENRQKFFNALAVFDAESLERFARPFKAITEARQNELLAAASSGEPGEARDRRRPGWIGAGVKTSSRETRVTLRDHFDHLKGWISGAYYSSEIGMRELGWNGEYFFESYPGCEHPEGSH